MEERLIEILRIALRNHVTDIHFALKQDDSLQIEMRVAGMMKKLRPAGDDARFFHYLMYRADLDLSSAMLPQTGSFEQMVDGRRLALRFALVTSYHVTSGVLRILNNHNALHISDLTQDADVLEYLLHITSHRYGLYLFSGPTGSGKTTTLYTILNETHGKKIFTLEDPVEIYSEKYVQLSVNDKRGLSYADGIRQLMRHDPDIVMIGEIRDDTAAAMALRCALTGHLVVSTIHAGSAHSAIIRMLDLGVKEYELSDVLHGVSCQRLYDTSVGSKQCFYEFMDRKEVSYYFAEKKASPSFIPLQKRISFAASCGLLGKDQILEDLD